MTRDQALAAADRAAQAVMNRKASWLDKHPALGCADPLSAMQMMLDGGPVSAEVLYRLIAGAEHAERPWTGLKPIERAAFEVFRATYLVLLGLVHEAEAQRREEDRARRVAMPAGMAERSFDDDQVPAFGERVVLR